MKRILYASADIAQGILWAWAPCAIAQGYPAKPVRLIVPLAPGGGNDLLSRAISKHLTETLGQSVIIDNRPGASGIIGTETAARAAQMVTRC